MMPNNSLFDDFPEISSEEWKRKIIEDLKGADYEETLVWQSPEGIAVEPFYHGDTVNVHQIRKKEHGWAIGQFIEVHSAKEANANASKSLENGADAIWFVLFSEECKIDVLLQSIDLNKSNVHLDLQFASKEYIKSIQDFEKHNKGNIHIHFDILSHLARTGNWFSSQKDDFEVLSNLSTADSRDVLTVDTTIYQNSGATMEQQLAFALSHANEYLHQLGHSGIGKVGFKMAVGSNYFFEIAKLRALRLLWATLASEYGINEECSVIATPSKRNKTLYDYNVNMLRTTTECMSAILGGADLVCNQPYDAIYHRPNDFGDRIALNQLLLLKNESYFDKINNAAEGAYYIEALTQRLAEKALVLFKRIEAEGGFLAQLNKGRIQDEIFLSASLEQKRFDEGEEVLVGANKYRNETDKMKGTIELDSFNFPDFGVVTIKPIIEKRLATDHEQKRLKNE